MKHLYKLALVLLLIGPNTVWLDFQYTLLILLFGLGFLRLRYTKNNVINFSFLLILVGFTYLWKFGDVTVLWLSFCVKIFLYFGAVYFIFNQLIDIVTEKTFYRILLLTAVIDATTVWLMFFQSTRRYILDFVVYNEEATYFLTKGIRFADIAIGGQSGTSFFFGMAIILLRNYERTFGTSLVKSSFVRILLYSSGLLCGRFIFAVLLFEILVSSARIKLLLTLIIGLTFSWLNSRIDTNLPLMSWMFEPLMNIAEGKQLSESTSILGSMWLWPDNLILGEGSLARNVIGVKTDLGLVRLTWGFGILGLILMMAPFVAFMLRLLSLTAIYKKYAFILIVYGLLFLNKELWLASRTLLPFFLIYLKILIHYGKYRHIQSSQVHQREVVLGTY